MWATHQRPSTRSNCAPSGCIEGGLSLDFNISKGVVDRWRDVLLRDNRGVVRRLFVCGCSVFYCSDSASIGQNVFGGDADLWWILDCWAVRGRRGFGGFCAQAGDDAVG